MRREIIEAVREMMDGSDEWCRAGRPCGGCDEEAAKLARAVLTAAVGALPERISAEQCELRCPITFGDEKSVILERAGLLATLTDEGP